MKRCISSPGSSSDLHAAIGVWYRGDHTYYVKRSHRMRYYPGVWSLFSMQFDPSEFRDPNDLRKAHRIMTKMSNERLGSTLIDVVGFLDSGNSDHNPYGRHVYLHLYEVQLDREPHLNPDYYTDGTWLTAEEYEDRSAGQPCGLCIRLWSDYSWLKGITDRPFIPREPRSS